MNKFFAIVLTLVLSLPITVWAVDEPEVVTEPLPIENQIDEDVEVKEIEHKQPISKRKIAKKFLAAMGGVAASSFAIFFILSIYNRIREGVLEQVKTLEGETSLETPDDIDDAVKTFLDKTKW